MSRTSPFFIPQKEIDTIDSMNEELIDEIIGQSVDIYKVSIDNTDENVYGESTTKYYEVGFRVNCLILFNEPEIIQDEFGPLPQTSIFSDPLSNIKEIILFCRVYVYELLY